MKYRHNKTYKFTNKALAGAFLALVLLFVVYAHIWQQPKMFSSFKFLKPLFALSSSLKGGFNDVSVFFFDKTRLQSENENLREMVSNLKGHVENLEIIKKENQELLALLGRNPQDKVLGRIILMPPETLYDTLLLDVGMTQGIKEGMKVTTLGSILLGRISEVGNDFSKVRLVSYFGEETNIFFENSGLSSTAFGAGGELMKIVLPRDIFGIEIGERIISAGGAPFLVGFVEEIEVKSADSLQTIFLRTPLNVRYIKSVLVI